MTEGYHANNKKTPQGVANVEVILFNHLMQERWKEQTEQWKDKQNNGKDKQSNGKSKQSNEKDFNSSYMANQRIYNLRIYCHELC
jgi:tRNA U38,U39,U40 pseudouridine synthase TruA